MNRWWASLARIALLLMAAGIVVIVAAPNTALAWARSEFRWLGQAVNWVEGLWPAVDTVHLLLFAALALLARLTATGLSWARLLLALVLFAGASETLQHWAPGREPTWLDFLQDLAGAALGLAPLAARDGWRWHRLRGRAPG